MIADTFSHTEENACIFEVYDTTYNEVCVALEKLEKDTENRFDTIHPKPYPSYIKEEIEQYRNEVVCHREIRSIGKKNGFFHFCIMSEMPELIHGLLRYLGKNIGKAELIINEKNKIPNTTTDYGVYVLFHSEVDKDEYEKTKAIIIEENNQRKVGERISR